MKQNNGSTAYPGLGAYLRDYLRQSFAVLKNPKQLLPTIVLGVIWLVLGIVGSNFWALPLPLWILSFLTYAQGGLYGGLLAAAGGIVGKVVIAAFLNAMIVPLFQGKKPFSGVAGGIAGLFRGAAVQGFKEASPLTGGTGAALLLYGFMNSRQDMQEAMVGIVAIIMLLKNIGTKGGFMTGLLFSAAQTFSRGRTPSRITVDRILSGLTIGFTLAVALTLLPFRPCVWVGLILLVVSIILSFFGKGNRSPSDAKPKKSKTAFSQRKTKKNDKLNHFVLFLLAGTIISGILAATPFSAHAMEVWSDPWKKYEAKDIAELYPHLMQDKPLMISVAPEAYTDTTKLPIELSKTDTFIIGLSKDAETDYGAMFSDPELENVFYAVSVRFTGAPSGSNLMKADVQYQQYAGEDNELKQDKYVENCPVIWDKVVNNDYPQAVTVDTGLGFTLALQLKSICLEEEGRMQGERLDFESYMKDPRYKLRISKDYDWSEVGSRSEWGDVLGLVDYNASWDGLRYSVLDTENYNREIVHQDVRFYMRLPKVVKSYFPEGATYPRWHYREEWHDNDWGFNPNGKLVVTADDRTPCGPMQEGWAESDFDYYTDFLLYHDNGKPYTYDPVYIHSWWKLYAGRDIYWGIGRSYDPIKKETPEEQIQQSIQNTLAREQDSYLGYSLGNFFRGREEELDEFDIDENTHVYAKYVHTIGDSVEAEYGASYVDGYGNQYILYRMIPELPYQYLNITVKIEGRIDTRQGRNGRPERPEVDEYKDQFFAYFNGYPEQALQALAKEPIYIEWSEPVWASSAGNASGAGNPGSIGGSLFGNLYDDYDDNGGSAGYDGMEDDTGNDPNSGNQPQPFDPGDYYDLHQYYDDWEDHADPFNSATRTFIGWFISMLFGGGFVGGTLGGGAGGGLSGGPNGEGPDYDGSGEGEDGLRGDYEEQEDLSEEEKPPVGPYDWNNPLPKGWYKNADGDISYNDPATGERMTYYLEGFDPDTGEPQYRSKKSGFEYGESLLRENYDTRMENASTLSQDAATGRRWAEEQHQQNQAKWDRERETGKTDMSEAWKKDQQKLRQEQYRERVAEQYGRSVDDIKGIKKDILKNRQKEAEEYGRQMAKDDWLGAAEKTASQIETASDIAVNALGEVTGPAGKAIKNAYTFAKPGMTKLSESLANGKDVYDTMTAVAQGTVEGAVGVLQNEVDGIGMAVGGDMVKTGLESYLEGKSPAEIARDMEKTAYKSTMTYGIGQGIGALGKKASDSATKGLKDQLGKTSKSFDKMGSWKNMAGDTAGKTLGKQQLAYQKAMNDKIANVENWSSAGTNLINDLFNNTVGDDLTDIVSDIKVAENQTFMNNLEAAQQKYGSIADKPGSGTAFRRKKS